MTTDTVGGVWTYTRELVAELLARDIAIALLTVGRAPSPGQAQWLAETEAVHKAFFHWEKCEAPLEWMQGNQQAYCDVESHLCRLARNFSAELLHSNQYCFGALPIDIPKVVVAHSDVLSWAQSCHGKSLEPSPWLDRYIALVSNGIRQAHTVVAPTRWMLTALAANFALPCDAMVIPNGRAAPPAVHDPGRKLQAITAGRLWDEAKNIALLSNVQCTLPILVAGEAACESQAVGSMNAGITLLGRLEEAELLHLFGRCAIYICTSRYEPFGLAPLEAALCGCAIVANDIPSLREVWGNGAIFFNDATTLSALLASLSNDPEELARAQQRSFLRARRYTASAMADRYVALYEAALTPRTALNHAS